MEKKRESNFELLRIICYFGIVLLHVYGNFMPEAKGSTRFCGIVINCLFNTGVSIFVLISGYYGIRSLSLKKILSFWFCLLFYSLAGEILIQSINSAWNIRGLIVACFPIFTRKWWYMSTYILLMLFSPWINRIVHTLNEKDFLKLLSVFLILFSVIPSSIGWTLFEDSGKGIGNLLFMYLLGQYFSVYFPKYQIRRKYCALGGIIVFGVMIILTTVKTVVKRDIGIEGPFFRDASIFTVILSVCIFLFFLQCNLSSNIINYIAKRGIGIYLCDCTIRTILLGRINLSQSLKGIVGCIGIVCLIMMTGVLVDSIRYFIVRKFDKCYTYVIGIIEKKVNLIINSIKKMEIEK